MYVSPSVTLKAQLANFYKEMRVCLDYFFAFTTQPETGKIIAHVEIVSLEILLVISKLKQTGEQEESE